MAKPAGGPKPPQGRKDFDEDDWTWCSPADAPVNPERSLKESPNPFLLVYLKLDSLDYFVELTTHWSTKGDVTVKKCKDGTVCFLCS